MSDDREDDGGDDPALAAIEARLRAGNHGRPDRKELALIERQVEIVRRPPSTKKVYVLLTLRAAIFAFWGAGAGVLLGGTAAWAIGGAALASLWPWTRLVRAVRTTAVNRRAAHISALLDDGRDDEAEAALIPYATRRRHPRAIRAWAFNMLANLAIRRKRYDDALGFSRKARALYPPRSDDARAVELGEVSILILAGNLTDARVRFDACASGAPAGRGIRELREGVEQLLAMCEGRHDFTIDELRDRAARALADPAVRIRLVTLAWAAHQLGELELAWQLLRDALARPKIDEALAQYPVVARWVGEHRDQALAEAPPDDR